MKDRIKASSERLLAWPPVAHHWTAWQRANGLRFTRWAAAISLFGYLSLFPLVVLAFVVVGVVLSRYPGVQAEVEAALQDALPLLFSDDGNGNPVDVQAVAEATTTAGIVSVVALLLAGLGWIDATVEGTRRMLGALRSPRNFVVQRAQQAGALVAVGTLLLLALVTSLGVRSAGLWVLDAVGVETAPSGWLVTLTADLVAAALVWIVIASFYWFSWTRPQRRWRSVLLAALMAVLCVGLLSRFAYFVVGSTLTNPVYGVLAIAAALLLFLYFVAAIHLYFACWLAVVEDAPVTAEEEAFSRREKRKSISLPIGVEEPTAAGAGRDGADDDG